MSPNYKVLLAVVVVVILIFVFGNAHGDDNAVKTTTESKPEFETSNPSVESRSFAGYECTSDCSGHEAGYAWAEKNDIDDGDDCDTAGEHSNSPSFAEGCHAFVDGETVPDKDADSGDDNSDGEN